jgi:hypothetical protein
LAKWREDRPHFIAESSCTAESWRNFSLRKEQGEASRISGKNGIQQAARGAGCRDRGRTVTESGPRSPSASRIDAATGWRPPVGGHRGPSARRRKVAAGPAAAAPSVAIARCDALGASGPSRAALQQGHPSARPKDALVPMTARSEFEIRRDGPSDQPRFRPEPHNACPFWSGPTSSPIPRAARPGGQRWRGNRPQEPSLRPSSAHHPPPRSQFEKLISPIEVYKYLL